MCTVNGTGFLTIAERAVHELPFDTSVRLSMACSSRQPIFSVKSLPSLDVLQAQYAA